MSMLLHEEIYRGREALARCRAFPVTVCGAGTLGGNIVEHLARVGFGCLTVVDRDRVEERNLSTQPYQRGDIGAAKAQLLAHNLFRAVGTTVTAHCQTLSPANAKKLLRRSELVVDTFDNRASRAAVGAWCAARGVPCLHAGMAGGYGEVLWHEAYRLPEATGEDLCDYPLARHLAMLVATVAAEAVLRFVIRGERINRTVTLEDLAIRDFV